MTNLINIHIGKCGSTVEWEMNKSKIPFKNVHMHKPNYKPGKMYVINIRNPISRFISAFNWRYHLIVKTKVKKSYYKKEKYLLEKYKNVNNFVTAMRTKKIPISSKKQIGHIRQDINFYLGHMVNKLSKKNVKGIVAQESLNADMKKIFNIDVGNTRSHKNTGYSKFLSNENRVFLKKILKKDYWCIDQLYKKGLIDKKKYSILSK